MNRLIRHFFHACIQVWTSIGIAQRLSISLVLLLGVSGIGLILYMGTRPDWQVLYDDLDPQTAAQIYEQIREDKIPVRLRNFGRTILVPYRQLNDVRLRTAQSGIDVGRKGTGFELFDEVKLGLTEMQQHVGFQRALQGELERMITQLPPVESAQVVLVIPSRRVFQRSGEKRGKAAVMTTVKPGFELQPHEVSSIRHLVAGAVDGVEPMDVTVSDHRGRLLARGNSGMEGMPMDHDGMMEARKHIELELKEKAEAILRPIVGMDSVVAMVSADIDFDRIERLSEQYDAENKVVLSERSMVEDQEKPVQKRSGVAGTGSNLVSIQNPEQAGAEKDMEQESRKTLENQYAVPKTTEKVRIHGPRIKSLSIAVTIAMRESGTERTANELDSLRKLVESAVGAETSGEGDRKDLVTLVESVFLAHSEPVSQFGDLPWWQRPSMRWMGQLLPASVGRTLIGLLVVIVLWRTFIRQYRGNAKADTDLFESRFFDDAQVIGSQDVSESSTPQPADIIEQTATQNPAVVAGLLENWLASEPAGSEKGT
jgi:flagellar M-ring protein FliF